MNYPYNAMPWQQQPYQPAYGQVSQPVVQSSISGKFVSSVSEIKPNDVPMDGSMGIFPQQDGSCIYARAWGNDGTISTVRYVPETQPEPVDTFRDDVLSRLEKIEAAVTKSSTRRPAAKKDE